MKLKEVVKICEVEELNIEIYKNFGLFVFTVITIAIVLLLPNYILVIHIISGIIYSFIRDSTVFTNRILNFVVNAIPISYVILYLFKREA